MPSVFGLFVYQELHGDSVQQSAHSLFVGIPAGTASVWKGLTSSFLHHGQNLEHQILMQLSLSG